MIYRTNVKCPQCNKYMNAVYQGNDKYYFRCICSDDEYIKTGTLSIDLKSPKKNKYKFNASK